MEYLVELHPHLLYRENDTGRTPLEMACDMHSRCHLWKSWDRESHVSAQGRYNCVPRSIVSRPAKDFFPIEERGFGGLQSKKKTYEICCGVDEVIRRNCGAKRRVVSLNEANEVARRLRISNGKSQKVVVDDHIDKVDEVEKWVC